MLTIAQNRIELKFLRKRDRRIWIYGDIQLALGKLKMNLCRSIFSMMVEVMKLRGIKCFEKSIKVMF